MKIFLILFFVCIAKIGYPNDEFFHNKELFEIYQMAIQYKYITNETACRYADCIYYFSKKYGLPTIRIARQVETESHFKWWRVSNKGRLGAMQITPEYYAHLLYKVDGGKLGKYLIKNHITNFTDIKKYYFRIGYNVEAGCIIMSNNYRVRKNYKLALLEYWAGANSPEYRRYRKNPDNCDYVKKIYY